AMPSRFGVVAGRTFDVGNGGTGATWVAADQPPAASGFTLIGGDALRLVPSATPNMLPAFTISGYTSAPDSTGASIGSAAAPRTSQIVVCPLLSATSRLTLKQEAASPPFGFAFNAVAGSRA